LGTKYLVVLCAGSTLLLAKQSLDEAPYKLSEAVTKLASITFLSLAFSYWIDNIGFITEGKLAAIFIKPSLGVSNWPVILLHQQTQSIFLASSSPRHQQVFWHRCRGLNYIFPRQLGTIKHNQVFWRHCRGKRRLLQGEFHTHILYFVLSFALLYFYLFRFIKNTKKLVSL
jgi:hypothetical protein